MFRDTSEDEQLGLLCSKKRALNDLSEQVNVNKTLAESKA